MQKHVRVTYRVDGDERMVTYMVIEEAKALHKGDLLVFSDTLDLRGTYAVLDRTVIICPAGRPDPEVVSTREFILDLKLLG